MGLAECAQTGPLAPATLNRMLCDAVLQPVVLAESGRVLALGREARTATRAQRRALAARDRGCVIPGCTTPPAACEAHHVTWWRHGGATDLDNLALLCGQHHSAVHAGHWSLVMTDGVPWVVPPSWMDPLRRPTRRTVHAAAHEARKLGQQLRLDATTDRTPGPTTDDP